MKQEDFTEMVNGLAAFIRILSDIPKPTPLCDKDVFNQKERIVKLLKMIEDLDDRHYDGCGYPDRTVNCNCGWLDVKYEAEELIKELGG